MEMYRRMNEGNSCDPEGRKRSRISWLCQTTAALLCVHLGTLWILPVSTWPPVTGTLTPEEEHSGFSVEVRVEGSLEPGTSVKVVCQFLVPFEDAEHLQDKMLLTFEPAKDSNKANNLPRYLLVQKGKAVLENWHNTKRLRGIVKRVDSNTNDTMSQVNLTLEIENVGLQDSGIYTCSVVTNRIGETANVSLAIAGPPTVTEVFIEDPMTEAGWQLNVACQYEALPDDGQVDLKHPNGTLLGTRNQHGDADGERSHTVGFSFTDITMRDNAANFTCNASNSYGWSQMTGMYTPEDSRYVHIRCPGDCQLTAGSHRVDIHCEATDMVSPSVATEFEWFHTSNQGTVTRLSEKHGKVEISITKSKNASHLVFHFTSHLLLGTLTCSMNVMGRKYRAQTDVKVWGGPSVSAPRGFHYVTRGNPVNLLCQVTAVPPVNDHRWYKPDTFRSVRNSNPKEDIESTDNISWVMTLTFDEATPEVTGSYRCTARNDKGQGEASISLKLCPEGKEANSEGSKCENDGESTTPAAANDPTISAAVTFGMGALAVAVVAVAVAVVVWIIRRRRKKEKRDRLLQTIQSNAKRNRDKKFRLTNSSSSEVTMGPSPDSHNFPRERLRVGELLGEGRFGQVCRGEALNIIGTGRWEEVAIKMCKDSAPDFDKEAFHLELSIVASIPKHMNVVNYLGCCTSSEPVMLIMEYISGGNLQEHLRSRREAPAVDCLSVRYTSMPNELRKGGRGISGLAVSNAVELVKRRVESVESPTSRGEELQGIDSKELLHWLQNGQEVEKDGDGVGVNEGIELHCSLEIEDDLDVDDDDCDDDGIDGVGLDERIGSNNKADVADNAKPPTDDCKLNKEEDRDRQRSDSEFDEGMKDTTGLDVEASDHAEGEGPLRQPSHEEIRQDANLSQQAKGNSCTHLNCAVSDDTGDIVVCCDITCKDKTKPITADALENDDKHTANVSGYENPNAHTSADLNETEDTHRNTASPVTGRPSRDLDRGHSDVTSLTSRASKRRRRHRSRGMSITSDAISVSLRSRSGRLSRQASQDSGQSWSELSTITGSDAADERLAASDLFAFALQIARGMNHLAENKIIHRDLAARNVLVTEAGICKIADFGLARMTEGDDSYERSSKGPLPIRWLAPECLTDALHSTQSDVWSYGVLLWEIITLGASPYPGMSAQQVFKLVCAGRKMEQPDHCAPELYELMSDCWSFLAPKRPSFSAICARLEEMLERERDYINMDLFESDNYVCLNPAIVEERL